MEDGLVRGTLAKSPRRSQGADVSRGFSEAIETFHNLAAQFDHIDLAGVTPEDLTAGGEDHAVGQGTGPLGIDGLGELVGISAGPVEIVAVPLFLPERGHTAVRKRRVAGLQELRNRGALVGWVDADGHEIETAVLETPIGFHKFGKLADAGAASGGPEVDEPDVAAAVGADFCGQRGIEVRHLTGLAFHDA